MTGRSHWWAVAHEADIPAAKPVPAKVGDLAVVLFRDGAGEIRALEDRCAHRRAPLSLGIVTPEGLVQCPYHGWRYDGSSGKCRAIPNLSSEEKVPGNFGVRHFATRIVDGFVYLWSGRHDEAGNWPAAIASLAGPMPMSRTSAALACPHAMYVALILDRPGALLSIDGVRLLDDFRWGDPRTFDGHVVGEFGAAWSHRRLDRLPSSPPLTLRVAVSAGSADAEITLRDESGDLLAAALVGAVPQGAMITQLRIAGWASPGPKGKSLNIRIRPSLDVETVARTRVAALPDWEALTAA